MDGIHDLGGMDGFGKVGPEPDEPVFHAPWEGRVMAIQRAMQFAGAWNIDMSRSALERLSPQDYLNSSYYKRWLLGIETNLVERGILTGDELAAGRVLSTHKQPARRVSPATIGEAIGRGSYDREERSSARFGPGDRVRARNLHPTGHTRLPRYVRGHVGTVALVHGCHAFPDARALGDEETAQWLYTVRFDGRELWGDDADPTLSVSVDAFESYLEAA